jgi:deazaflavin-dependent oxidoreductase (nitroreductase family)
MFGNRFLLLTHIGRRSGLPHRTVLEVMEYRDAIPEFIVMSGFGHASQWFHNIELAPPEIEVGRRHFAAAYRILGANEAVEVVREYERHNRLLRPIIRPVLSRLLGWKYSGSDSDRFKLVAQLPLIAFRPR